MAYFLEGGFMAFRVESKEELLKSLDEARRLIVEREKSLKERMVSLLGLGTTLQKPSMCLQVKYWNWKSYS
jgi:hypothetical protein